jgi:hypothetical protein
VIAAQVGECVDSRLGHLEPLADANLLANIPLELIDARDGGRFTHAEKNRPAPGPASIPAAHAIALVHTIVAAS